MKNKSLTKQAPRIDRQRKRMRNLSKRGFVLIAIDARRLKPKLLSDTRMYIRGEKDIEKCFRTFPDSAYGIALGKSGLIAIRTRGEAATASFRRLFGNAGLPSNAPRLTGPEDSACTLFRLPPGVRITGRTDVFGEYVDVLARGAFVIAPECLSDDEHEYDWCTEPPQVADIALLPAALLEPLLKLERPDLLREEWRATLMSDRAESLRIRGKSQEQILTELREVNAGRCLPPLDDDTIIGIAESAAALSAGSMEEVFAIDFLAEKFEDGRRLRFEDDGCFWSYVGTHWKIAQDRYLMCEMRRFARKGLAPPARPTLTFLNDALEFLKLRCLNRDSDFFFNKTDAPPVINVQNGELWIDDDGAVELREHSPESFQKSVMPVRYDPEAKCPEFDGALSEIFGGVEGPKRRVKLWHELTGYIIQPKRSFPLVLALIGDGPSAKSSLIQVLRWLMGPGPVLEWLDLREPVDVRGLEGKRALIIDNVSRRDEISARFLKTISQDGIITIGAENLSGRNFKNSAVPILVCSEAPRLRDESRSMARRLLVIELPQQFNGEGFDPSMFGRIFRNELPGVLNRALSGLRRLKKSGLSRARNSFEASHLFLSLASEPDNYDEDLARRLEHSS